MHTGQYLQICSRLQILNISLADFKSSIKTCRRILTEFCLLLKIMSFASKSVRPFKIAE